jgi:hypothetical protein
MAGVSGVTLRMTNHLVVVVVAEAEVRSFRFTVFIM